MAILTLNKEFKIRKMKQSDIADVLVIERDVQITPWSEKTFQDCLKVRYDCYVLEMNTKIIGFVIFFIKANECQICDLCVQPDQQHKGYGKSMLEYAIKIAASKAVDSVLLEVRASNVKAMCLYQKLGFEKIGIRKDYYATETSRENAIVYKKYLN